VAAEATVGAAADADELDVTDAGEPASIDDDELEPLAAWVGMLPAADELVEVAAAPASMYDELVCIGI